MPQVIGLDIGGANLKAASADGQCFCRPFSIWKSPERLAAELQDLLRRFAPIHVLGVTMTAELADCYRTKSEGVRRILDAVAACVDLERIYVWQTASEFVDVLTAQAFPMLTAAANWHALATWIGPLVPKGRSLLIDIGTTTTDLIPIQDGFPASVGMTDTERLVTGELVYTGIRRTPLCAVASAVRLHGTPCRVAAELFATTLDQFLLLNQIAEDEHDCETADGRPATKANARDRIARMLGADAEQIDSETAVSLAAEFRDRQREQIFFAIDQIVAADSAPIEHVILSGAGAFLGEEIAGMHPRLSAAAKIRLDEQLPVGVSESACAFAIARLAAERCV